jgi:ubiquinone/menaquinone biosynthesis C-methylase UbiE
MDDAAATTDRRFDLWAPAYDDCALQPVHHAARDGVLGFVAGVAVAPRRVLDLGCGTGRLLVAAAHALPDATLVGLDRSAAMLAVARHAAPGAILVRGTAERLPFAGATFDLVSATFAARHWADPGGALAQIRRVLRPGGAAVFADAFDRAPPRRVVRRGPARFLPPRWAALFDRAGLRVVNLWYADGHGPVPVITLVAATASPTR